MTKIIVEVMPRAEIHDPQGEAITRACQRLGYTGVAAVRQGKRFEVQLSEGSGDGLARVRDLAAELLANPVIEEFSVREAGL